MNHDHSPIRIGREGKMKYVILAICLLIIVAALLYYYVFTGIITIDSQRPLDAVVKIDGNEVGETPLKLRLRAGTHDIVTYKEGFESWQGQATVGGSSPETLSIKLRFMVKSEPPGATVKINGEEVGITDMPIDLAVGVYTFEFKKAGYGRVKYMAEVPNNVSMPFPVAPLVPLKDIRKEQQESIAEAEKPAVSGYGSIQVNSTPDAEVSLDGELQGETPLTIAKVRVGSYVLKLSKEGYKDSRQTVYINKGETTKVAVELKTTE